MVVVCYLWVVDRCSLRVVSRSLLVARCSMFVVDYVLFVVCCLLCIVCRLLSCVNQLSFGGCCVLLVVLSNGCCSLFGVCCSLSVACRAWFVVCRRCSLFVVWLFVGLVRVARCSLCVVCC